MKHEQREREILVFFIPFSWRQQHKLDWVYSSESLCIHENLPEKKVQRQKCHTSSSRRRILVWSDGMPTRSHYGSSPSFHRILWPAPTKDGYRRRFLRQRKLFPFLFFFFFFFCFDFSLQLSSYPIGQPLHFNSIFLCKILNFLIFLSRPPTRTVYSYSHHKRLIYTILSNIL